MIFGIGSPKDACHVMELGADGILLNTAVSGAKDPVKMAEAMKLGIHAGRLSYEAGRSQLNILRKHQAQLKV